LRSVLFVFQLFFFQHKEIFLFGPYFLQMNFFNISPIGCLLFGGPQLRLHHRNFSTPTKLVQLVHLLIVLAITTAANLLLMLVVATAIVLATAAIGSVAEQALPGTGLAATGHLLSLDRLEQLGRSLHLRILDQRTY